MNILHTLVSLIMFIGGNIIASGRENDPVLSGFTMIGVVYGAGLVVAYLFIVIMIERLVKKHLVSQKTRMKPRTPDFWK